MAVPGSGTTEIPSIAMNVRVSTGAKSGTVARKLMRCVSDVAVKESSCSAHKLSRLVPGGGDIKSLKSVAMPSSASPKSWHTRKRLARD